MMQGTLALLMRSVRDDARRPKAHAIRIGGVLLVLCFLLGAAVQGSDSGAPGLVFFRSMSFVAIGLVSLAGMGYFATAIAEEREEGTLGLLLLADISPLSILLGKSTNRVLSAWLVFAAQFPFALLALTLGGLTVSQITAAYLSLAAYLFLVANLALVVSVLSRRMREATAATALLLLMMHGFVPWLRLVTDQLLGRGRLAADGTWVSLVTELDRLHHDVSVIDQIKRIFTVNEPVTFLSAQVLFSFGMGALLFVVAWLCFRSIIWAADVTPPAREAALPGNRRYWKWVPRPWNRALMWKDFHFVAGGMPILVLKLVAYPLLTFVCFRYADWVEDLFDHRVWVCLRDGFLAILIFECLFYSSQLFHVEKRGGTFPTLLMLPVTPSRLAWQKLAGCLIASTPTLVALGLLFAFPEEHESPRELLINWSMLWGVCLTLLVCQLTMVCSLSVAWGAFPLALAITLVTGAVAMPFLSAAMYFLELNYRDEPYAKIGPIVYATAMISGGLQFEIGRRIKRLAAE